MINRQYININRTDNVQLTNLVLEKLVIIYVAKLTSRNDFPKQVGPISFPIKCNYDHDYL